MMATLNVRQAQRRLAVVWVGAFCCVLMILTLQTISGHYQGMADAVWKWFLSSMGPTTCLILGALVAQEQKARSAKNDSEVNLILYRSAFGLSLLYVVAILLTIGWQPIAARAGRSPLDLIADAAYSLAAVQSVLTIVLGYLFVKSK